MIDCQFCKRQILPNDLFCPHCERELFSTDHGMQIVLGKEPPVDRLEIIKELILNLEKLGARAGKEKSRSYLIHMFKVDLLGIAADAHEQQVYCFPKFEEALIRAAKKICEKI